MKNKIAIIFLMLMIVLLTSCRPNDVDKIKELQNDFTVSEHIKENYLYQQSSKLLINGHCESGGMIVATIYSKQGTKVSSSSGIANEFGNYEVVLNTPAGSYSEFYLEVKDFHGKFVKTYKNILFGEVHLLLGDHLINDDITKESDTNAGKQIYYLDYTNITNQWEKISLEKNDNNFIGSLSNILLSSSKYKNVPLGFVDITFDKSYIEEWLLKEDANENKSVLTFLNTFGKYYENPYQKDQMSYIVNNLLSDLYNYSFANIIFSMGLSDFSELYGKINLDNYYNVYAKMLLYVLRNLENSFYNYDKLSIIQTNSIDVDNINELRNIQAKVANLVTSSALIPTYDMVESSDQDMVDLLAKRYYDIVYGKKEISEYANHFTDEVDHTITIEFSNSSIFEYHFDNIKFYDQDGKLIELDSNKIKSRFNQLIIDLSYEIETVDDNEENENKISYYQISRIEYAQDEIVIGEIIKNNSDLPVIPFVIYFD